MAKVTWKGDVGAVTQVTIYKLASVGTTGDTWQWTVGNKTVGYTQTDALISTVVDGLAAAWNGSSFGEFREMTAVSDGVDQITLTARIAGMDVDLKLEQLTPTPETKNPENTSVAPTGPNWVDNPNNYENDSGARGLPAATDELYVQGSSSMLYGLAGLNAIDLALFSVDARYNGQIGLLPSNTNGYVEYRQQQLQLGALTAGSKIDIGRGQGPGPRFVNLDMRNSGVAAITVTSTGPDPISDVRALQIQGTTGGSTIEIRNGRVDIGRDARNVSVFAGIDGINGNIRLWNSIAMAGVPVKITGGALVELHGTIGGSFTMHGGSLRIEKEDGVIDLLATKGPASITYKAGGTITSLDMDDASSNLDFSQTLNTVTVSAATIKRGSVSDPNEVVTWTAGIQPGRVIAAREA